MMWSLWALCCCAAAILVVYGTRVAGATLRAWPAGSSGMAFRPFASRLPRWGGVCGWLLVEAALWLCVADGVRGLGGHHWASDAGGLVAPMWDGSGPGLALHQQCWSAWAGGAARWRQTQVLVPRWSPRPRCCWPRASW
jgi:hypothetical protein